MSFPRLSWLSLIAVLCLPLMTGACGVPVVIAAASYGADGASLLSTGKTGTDHLLSMSAKQDCAMWRMMKGKPICKEREDGTDPYDVDYKTPERMQSEDGVYYQAPLRSASGMPPVSWDAAAYKTDEHPKNGPPKNEPVTATAESPATPAPITLEPQVAASETPPPPATTGAPPSTSPKKKGHSAAKQPKKAKPAVAKKPSPGPAASRS